jgi:putative phosphoesterase
MSTPMGNTAKKLLVISDSHGHISALRAVLNYGKDIAPDCAVFLGDGIQDIDRAAAGFSCVWHKVRGNNDPVYNVPEAAVLDFGGHRFFLCHGHRYSLYRSNDTLIAAARNNGADTVLFGHIHVPSLINEDGLLLINPGSVGRPRSNAGATFAVIECLPETPLKVEFFGIDLERNYQITGLL